MSKDSKINVVEAVLFGIVIICADAFDALALLAAGTVIGWPLIIVSWLFGISVSLITIFWLIIKGVSIKWFLSGNGLELIPVLNSLPARSVAFIATVALDWAPKSIKKVAEAAKITKPISK